MFKNTIKGIGALIIFLAITNVNYSQSEYHFLDSCNCDFHTFMMNGSFEYLESNPNYVKELSINNINYWPRYQLQDWKNCGSDGHTPPTIHQNGEIQFGVKENAFDGDVFLGMVVRIDDTWESIGLELINKLIGGKTYRFSLYTKKSSVYSSPIAAQNKEYPYDGSVILRVFGGQSICDRGDLLFSSEPIENEEWSELVITIEPENDYRYMRLEAFFIPLTIFPYNGNVLIDYMSDVYEVHE